mmetsp:Transcript_77433/g.194725  ORF Transcript_77433/g.194725 Transcript_77433/m.194725 type:complete len:246 (+) Transcript_77433:52-789(+)
MVEDTPQRLGATELPLQVTHEVEASLKSTRALQHELAIICTSTDVAMPQVPFAEQEPYILCGPAVPDLFANPGSGMVVRANGLQQVLVGCVSDVAWGTRSLVQAAKSVGISVPILATVAAIHGVGEVRALPMPATIFVWDASSVGPLLTQVQDGGRAACYDPQRQAAAPRHTVGALGRQRGPADQKLGTSREAGNDKPLETRVVGLNPIDHTVQGFEGADIGIVCRTTIHPSPHRRPKGCLGVVM